MKQTAIYLLGVLALAIASSAQAGNISGLTTFVSDTPARAADVNNNFSQVKSAVDDNDGRITTNASKIDALQASIQQLQNDLAAAQSAISTLQSTVASQNITINNLQNSLSNVVSLNQYLTVSSDSRGPLVQFSGVNVQVINGMGATNTVNGLGNLIIGYDEIDDSGTNHCTVGYNASLGAPVANGSECTAAGGLWVAGGFKSGSHYLVVGSKNNYSGYGGVLSGFQNTSNYGYANVTGGSQNTSSGPYSSVSGGSVNQAGGDASSVGGGAFNSASADVTVVSGGEHNTASNVAASVSGGWSNTSSGEASSISGGFGNQATNKEASVSGGLSNTASGATSNVSGGSNRSATGTDNWAAGSLFELN